MRIQVFQHVPFEGPANIGLWAEQHGHEVALTRWDQGQIAPPPSEYDWLVVMGGLMSAYEEDRYPWLVQDKRAIRDALQADRLVIGVCLGAQLLADVLGGRVYANTWKEVGWHAIRPTPAARTHGLFADLPEVVPAFHWHGDTFELPAGLTTLASSEATPNQLFTAENVLAMQFHWDYSADSIRKMIRNCPDDLRGGPYVQPPEQMLLPDRQKDIAAATGLLFTLLDRLAAGRKTV